MACSFLQKKLEENKIKYQEDYRLCDASTFKIGGICRMAVFPSSAEQIAICISLLDGLEENFFVIGKGSNSLFYDGYVDKIAVFTSFASGITLDGDTVTAEAGVGLVSLCERLAREGLSGLEFACGIPGSVGGAVYMNAGAHGGSISDVLIDSRAYDRRSGEIIEQKEHGFAYRKSIYRQEPLVCLEARFKLERADTEQIRIKMRGLLAKRRSTQPVQYPSAGSYFKRPERDFAGRLIEACGLKGMACGGAQVSELHAGFIINSGGATFEDVITLEELIRERVYQNTGVLLEREVEIIK